MNIITNEYVPEYVKSSIDQYNPSYLDVPGSFWIMTDDGYTLAVICVEESEIIGGFALLQSVIAQIQTITKYIYILIETSESFENQIISLQEFGSFVVTTSSISEYIPSFIKFISNQKRRQEKAVHPPKRSLRMFTPGEQMLLTISGLGERKVKDLLGHFGPVAWVLAGMTWHDTPDYLNSISKKDIDTFRNDIGIDDNMILSVIMEGDK